MAEGISGVLCKYFVHGACRNGDRCMFSHDLKMKPSMVCKFYLNGSCNYGSNCRFDHIRSCKPVAKSINSAIDNAGHNAKRAAVSNTAAHINPVCPVQVNSGDKIPAASKMVTLHKHGEMVCNGDNHDKLVGGKLTPAEWVQASEFVPGQQWRALNMPSSYVEAVHSGCAEQQAPAMVIDNSTNLLTSGVEELCPYAAHGDCPYGYQCQYVHGDICDMCLRAVLSPFDMEQRQKHAEECLLQHEQNMEMAFAVQRSEDKVCGICMDVVWQKQPATAQRFGILSDCAHVYCLDCIRKWRCAKQFENKIIRSCPECRVKSDFVTPSKYWVESKEDKEKLIANYKKALSTKACKYFDQGKGECPFGDKCFYLHAYPDGRKASPRPVRRRHRQNADGDVTVVHRVLLWDFLDNIQEQRSVRDVVEMESDRDWQEFFVRLQLLGFELPSDDDDLYITDDDSDISDDEDEDM